MQAVEMYGFCGKIAPADGDFCHSTVERDLSHEHSAESSLSTPKHALVGLCQLDELDRFRR